MSVLVVVGGSKGIGSAFIDKLSKDYTNVFNIDISKPEKEHPNVSYNRMSYHLTQYHIYFTKVFWI